MRKLSNLVDVTKQFGRARNPGGVIPDEIV